MYDVIVVGGGHNGLTCAAFLARTGKHVLVLEARDVVGGFCTTDSTVAEAPGFQMNACALDHVLTNIPPSIVDQLELHRFGLRWVQPDPFMSYLHPEGSGICFWRNHGRTVEEIRRLSRQDAEQYDRFVTILRDLWYTIVPYLHGHPKRPGPRTIADVAFRLARTRKNFGAAVRVLLSSPGSVIEEWFQREELKAALACLAVGSMTSLDEPGSGVILSMMSVQHEWGLRRPVGGNGAFAKALAQCAVRYGGEVRTGVPVAQVLLEDDRAAGVITEAGETISAKAVVAAVDPHTVLTKLLPPEAVPEQTRAELRGMSVLRNNVSCFKGDVALSSRPRLARHHPNDPLLASCLLLAPDIDYVRRATNASIRGELADEIPLWVATPTVLDRTLVPPGSHGDSLYIYLPSVPYRLASGDWESEKEKVLDRSLDILENYAPGTKDLVIGAHATSSKDLCCYSPVYKGHLFHVDMTLSQFGPWRPIPSLSGYRTPVAGLWHTGAGAHPLGALNGWSGRTTARVVARALG